MNILPHKSWHVRTKKNIARVRRDEEKAKQEEEEKLRRINLAEHESRISLLRAKSDSRTQTKSQQEPSASASYINLFDDVKDKISKDSEREVENRVEQEKWEVKAGIFSYLDGRYKHDNTKQEEWYLKSPLERIVATTEPDNLKDSKLKHQHDPLEDIKRNLAKMRKSENDSVSSEKVLSGTVPKVKAEIKQEMGGSFTLSHSVKNKKSKKQHKVKHKKRKHKKRHSSSDSSDSDKDQSSHYGNNNNAKEALIHKLRQERLERERKERLRTSQLLQGPNTGKAPQEALESQKYNSQFNPHIARQNQNR